MRKNVSKVRWMGLFCVVCTAAVWAEGLPLDPVVVEAMCGSTAVKLVR